MPGRDLSGLNWLVALPSGLHLVSLTLRPQDTKLHAKSIGLGN